MQLGGMVAPLTIGLISVCANRADPGGVNMSREFLDEVGVEIDEVTHASAAPSMGANLESSISAFRYRGASPQVIRAAINDAMRDAGETMATVTRGGKEVDVAQGPLSNGVVFYVADDTLFALSGVDEQVDEMLSALP